MQVTIQHNVALHTSWGEKSIEAGGKVKKSSAWAQSVIKNRRKTCINKT